MDFQEETSPTTLYVGNLDQCVTEELLITLFSQIGPIYGCKLVREVGNDPYAFVEFATHQAASTALVAMNKRIFLNRELKVNWATTSSNAPKPDTSDHHHIFVGDLSPEIDTQALKEAFSPFGEISNCRIVRDPQTLRSKGYAFVSFVHKSDAENAIISMNGQWLGNRSIRTNWSTRKPPPPKSMKSPGLSKVPTYEEVYRQSSPSNCTVYCGGFVSGVTEQLMEQVFAPFGAIIDIRCFSDKGYAFVKFIAKESAARAIEATHNRQINGQTVKCFWGKEPEPTFDPQIFQQQHQAAAAAAAAVAASSSTAMWATYGQQHQQYVAPGVYYQQQQPQQQIAAPPFCESTVYYHQSTVHYQYHQQYQDMGPGMMTPEFSTMIPPCNDPNGCQ